MKINLLVSISGGETSSYLAQWLWLNKQERYNMVFVFANTGLEDAETIRFLLKTSVHFGFKIHMIEASVQHGKRKSTSYREVRFSSLSFDGSPMEEIIKKYGIPNVSFKHCTRELKANPIAAFGKKYFKGQPYYTAIGIRSDEADRASVHRIEKMLIYPLISDRPMTKQKINFWWSLQPFRLNLKGYEGNCTFCFKKSDRKLFQLAKERPKQLAIIGRLEKKYEYHYANREVQKDESGKLIPIRFFRQNRSVKDIINESRKFTGSVEDDHVLYDEDESCEVFSECGIDN